MRARTDRKIGRIVIVVVGLLIAANLMIFGALAQSTERPGQDRPVAIEMLFPEESEVIPPQQEIGVDLRDDLQGMLWVNDTLIPADQVHGDPNFGQIMFEPGPGKEFSEFQPGTTRVRVEYWPQTETYEEAKDRNAVGTFSWFFKVG